MFSRHTKVIKLNATRRTVVQLSPKQVRKHTPRSVGAPIDAVRPEIAMQADFAAVRTTRIPPSRRSVPKQLHAKPSKDADRPPTKPYHHGRNPRLSSGPPRMQKRKSAITFDSQQSQHGQTKDECVSLSSNLPSLCLGADRPLSRLVRKAQFLRHRSSIFSAPSVVRRIPFVPATEQTKSPLRSPPINAGTCALPKINVKQQQRTRTGSASIQVRQIRS